MDIDKDLGLTGNIFREEDLLTTTSGCPLLMTSICLDTRACKGTEAVDISLH